MKLTNAELAAILAEQARAYGDATNLAFVHLLLQRPTSQKLNALAFKYLALPTLPSEDWTAPLPITVAAAEAALAMEIELLNETTNPADTEILARRVAWAAHGLARRLEWQRKLDVFVPPPTTIPIDTAARRAAVVAEVNKRINERNPK